MKKIFTFFMLAVAVSAWGSTTREVGIIDTRLLGLSENPSELTAGTVLAQTASATLKVAFDDSYKTLNTMTVTYDGETVVFEKGVGGSNNPKDKDYATPSNTLCPPASGCAYQFTASQDGVVFLFGKFYGNKSYTVFEDGVAIGYGFSAHNGEEPCTFNLTAGENGLTAPMPKLEELGGTTTSFAFFGLMKISVKSGSTYLVNGNATRMICFGFIFDTADDSTVNYGDITLAAEGSLAPSNIPTAIGGITSSMLQPGAIHTLGGQRVPATARPGAYIVKGRKLIVK